MTRPLVTGSDVCERPTVQGPRRNVRVSVYALIQYGTLADTLEYAARGDACASLDAYQEFDSWEEEVESALALHWEEVAA